MREMEVTDRLYLASEYVGNTQVSDHHRAHVQQLQRTPPHSVGYDQVDRAYSTHRRRLPQGNGSDCPRGKTPRRTPPRSVRTAGALDPAMLKPRGREYLFAPAIFSHIFACCSLNFHSLPLCCPHTIKTSHSVR